MRQSTQVRVCSHHDLYSGSVSSLTHNTKFLQAGKHSCAGMFDTYRSCLLMSTAYICTQGRSCWTWRAVTIQSLLVTPQ